MYNSTRKRKHLTGSLRCSLIGSSKIPGVITRALIFYFIFVSVTSEAETSDKDEKKINKNNNNNQNKKVNDNKNNSNNDNGNLNINKRSQVFGNNLPTDLDPVISSIRGPPHLVSPENRRTRVRAQFGRRLRLHTKWVTGAWSRCSKSCGGGVRTRGIRCRGFRRRGAMGITMPKHRCPDPKPEEFEPCNEGRCQAYIVDNSVNVIQITSARYIWQFSGFTSCSAECLGGLQTSIIKCVSERYFVPVDEDLCDASKKPKSVTQICNDWNCPPEWRIKGNWSACNETCGFGHKTRAIECIEEVSSWGSPTDVLVLPPDTCNLASFKPESLLPCAQVNCPAEWRPGNWTACSVSCGKGVQKRTAKCHQKQSSGVTKEVDVELCEEKKPETLKVCHKEECPTGYAKIIQDESAFVQTLHKKRISVTVGGRLTVMRQTDVEIKCHVENFPQHYVKWYRDGVLIPKPDAKVAPPKKRKHHIEILDTGSLIIHHIRYKDKASYTCKAGNQKASTRVKVHSMRDAHKHHKYREKIIKSLEKETRQLREIAVDSDSKLTQKHPLYGQLQMTENWVQKGDKKRKYYTVWIPREWTECSIRCGGIGKKSRNVTCEVGYETHFKEVDASVCQEQQLKKPAMTASCGYPDCPSWQATEWGDCTNFTCQVVGKAEQRRRIGCILPNKTAIKESYCLKDERPTSKRLCNNPKCVASWVASDWSECTANCGEGVRTRTITCRWQDSALKAGDLCNKQEKPTLTESCTAKPCKNMMLGDDPNAKHLGACLDQSTLCSLVYRMKLCRFRMYEKKCCSTCRKYTLRRRHRRRVRKQFQETSEQEKDNGARRRRKRHGHGHKKRRKNDA